MFLILCAVQLSGSFPGGRDVDDFREVTAAPPCPAGLVLVLFLSFYQSFSIRKITIFPMWFAKRVFEFYQ